MSDTSKKKDLYLVNLVIGIGIMFLFRFLPITLPHITDTGMEILGIFIGTLYLWSTSDPIWASLLAIFMIGLSNYSDMSTVLTSTFGNPMVVQVLFLMNIVNCLVENHLTEYVGRFFLTRKICRGKPWMLTFFIMMGCVLMAAFMSAFAPIFLFWPILYDIFSLTGMKAYEKYPTIMVILVVIAALLGFPVPPFMSNGLALITNYTTITTNMGHPVIINSAGYLILGLINAFICTVVIILFCKFVLRPDVSKLKSITPEILNRNPLPPMSLRQKLIGISFAIFILILLCPSLVPSTALGIFVKNNTYGICVGYTFLLCAVRIEKKPLMNFAETMKRFSWPTYFLIASAILLGNALTSDSTGISAFLNAVLMPVFQNVSPSMFSIIILLFTVVLTNVCNSFVIGILMQPVIATYCLATGVNSAPITAVMIQFVLLSAAITPAASPFAAMLFGNKDWLKPGQIYKYSFMFVCLELLIVLVCVLPLSNILLG